MISRLNQHTILLALSLLTNRMLSKVIGNLKVPPKSKIFFWRAANYVLPNKVNLLVKGFQIGAMQHCRENFENAKFFYDLLFR